MSYSYGFPPNTGVNIVPIITPRDLTEEEKEIKLLKIQVEQLSKELENERKLRYDAEQKIAELTAILEEKNTKRRKKEQKNADLEYSEFTSAGKPKAKAAEAIRSYEDFKAFQDYYLEQNNIRDWMLWTVGVSMGLRISDLLKLQIKHILNADLTFRKRTMVIEKKTSKLNNCLITESVIDAVSKYFDSINWHFDLEDYLFKSKKTKGKMKEQYGWKIISDAGKVLKMPFNTGSHTLRKSFANIAACVDKSSIDMNAITKIQGLLNHSEQKVTMRYLGTYQDMYDKARIAVSDFCLGKTQIHTLTAGNVHTIDELCSKLDALETRFFDNKGEEYEQNSTTDKSSIYECD